MKNEENKMDKLIEMLSQLVIQYTRTAKGDGESC